MSLVKVMKTDRNCLFLDKGLQGSWGNQNLSEWKLFDFNVEKNKKIFKPKITVIMQNKILFSFVLK